MLPDFEKKLWFLNASCDEGCRNACDECLLGTPCHFNRKEIEGFRDEKRGKECDQRIGTKVAECSSCALRAGGAEWWKKNPQHAK